MNKALYKKESDKIISLVNNLSRSAQSTSQNFSQEASQRELKKTGKEGVVLIGAVTLMILFSVVFITVWLVN